MQKKDINPFLHTYVFSFVKISIHHSYNQNLTHQYEGNTTSKFRLHLCMTMVHIYLVVHISSCALNIQNFPFHLTYKFSIPKAVRSGMSFGSGHLVVAESRRNSSACSFQNVGERHVEILHD